jgi:[ribosomal protein S5]-alanine N-acetyltransferase
MANRSYFAAFISDRGDAYFDQFTEQYNALLAEQEAGAGAYYVLVAEDGSVLGRFNLVLAGNGTAELGYRVAQHVAGRGVATTTVRELCRLAAARHGLRTLRAATSHENIASQKVLTKVGFVPVGPADPAHIGGKQGTWYQRDLAACDAPQQRDGVGDCLEVMMREAPVDAVGTDDQDDATVIATAARGRAGRFVATMAT